MEKLIEQEQEKPTKTRADKRTRRKNSFFSDAVDKLHKKDSSYRNISYFADAAQCYYRRTCAAQFYR